MRGCSVCKNLEIVGGGLDDYKSLAEYHYRDSELGPFAAIFALKAAGRLAVRLSGQAVGVIVYMMPTPSLELRNVATGDFFAGLDRDSRLALINANVRRIARVIIEPRFRGLGLAARLVRETMPRMNVPIVEAMAVMGHVNPFFEKAGMQPYTAPVPEHCVRLKEALSAVGIERRDLIDPLLVHRKLKHLDDSRSRFIEGEFRRFLRVYGRRRFMSDSPKRTRFIAGKLTERPVYYIWFNENIELRTEN